MTIRGKGSERKPLPIKHSRDSGHYTLGMFVNELRRRIERGDDKEALCDFMDEEFIFGCWGYIFEREPLLARDVRGLALAMYRAGKGEEIEE